jgi:hypothetical protein
VGSFSVILQAHQRVVVELELSVSACCSAETFGEQVRIALLCYLPIPVGFPNACGPDSDFRINAIVFLFLSDKNQYLLANL